MAQNQADVVALASGHLLPMRADVAGHRRSDIEQEVLGWLRANAIPGQGPIGPDDVSVTFFASRAAAAAGAPQCSTVCPVMKVTTPTARVQFGLGALVAEDDHLDVRRSAVVAMQSELVDRRHVLPFWLPSGCGYGPVQADTTQGGQGGPTPTPTPTPTPMPTPTPTPTPMPTRRARRPPAPRSRRVPRRPARTASRARTSPWLLASPPPSPATR